MKKRVAAVIVLALLAAGAAFLRAEVPAPAGTLSVQAVEGHGSIHGADGSTRAWRAGTPILAGDRVAADDGQVILSAGKGLHVSLGPSTTLSLQSLIGRRVGRELRAELSLEEGRTAVIASTDTTVRVTSTVGRADITNAAVEVARAGDAMRVAALKGKAAYASSFMGNVQYAVSEGEEILADKRRGEHQIHPLRKLDSWQKRILEAPQVLPSSAH